MKAVKQCTFITAIQRNKLNRPVVYYIQCPSVMEEVVAISYLKNSKLRPRRQRAAGIDSLRERCIKIYREREFDLQEFRTVDSEEELRRYRLN
jgi:hypothetical protein